MTTGSRITSGGWGRRRQLPGQDAIPAIDVVIPTAGRLAELAVTLAGLAAQDDPPFRVIVSDQSDTFALGTEPSIRAMVRVLEAQGRPVQLLRHLPRLGLAEHRHFLLGLASADFILYLDDDVWLEPGQLARLHDAIRELSCGFVGSAVQGLSYLDDDRPHERRTLSIWRDGVHRERMGRATAGFERWELHNAANLVHAAAEFELGDDEWLPYRIAWVGGCVLYRRQALIDVGGFDFWTQLPAEHSGEDVAAQWRVMERFGGAGILPSGAVHLEAPTTIPVRTVDAFDVVFSDAATDYDDSSE